MKGWAARLVLRKRPKVIRNWLIPKVKDVKMFFIKVGVNIVIFCRYCWFVFVLFFLCVCVCVFPYFFELCDLTPCSR